MGSKVTLEGKLMFPNEFVAAAELQGRDVHLTISSVVLDNLQMKGGKKEKKPVIHFQETPKKLVLNKTNADSIAALHGREASAWVGKRVTIFPTKTTFGRETVDCIRIREKLPPPKGGAPASAPAPTESAPPSSGGGDASFVDSLGDNPFGSPAPEAVGVG